MVCFGDKWAMIEVSSCKRLMVVAAAIKNCAEDQEDHSTAELHDKAHSEVDPPLAALERAKPGQSGVR